MFYQSRVFTGTESSEELARIQAEMDMEAGRYKPPVTLAVPNLAGAGSFSLKEKKRELGTKAKQLLKQIESESCGDRAHIEEYRALVAEIKSVKAQLGEVVYDPDHVPFASRT